MAKKTLTAISPSIVLSYVFDWIIIIAVAAAGGGLEYVKPVHRPFSLLDLDISYPYVPETITTATLVIVSFVAPFVLIFLVVAIFVPGRSIWRSRTRAQCLRLKAWELHIGWAGLALSVASAFFVTQAAKNLFGRPRPDFLARCMPDLTNVGTYVVGGLGQDISERWSMVNSSICTTTDYESLQDGFRSFPSGHSSFSWSGLLYLSLFLCSKFGCTIPFLPVQPTGSDSVASPRSDDTTVLPLHNSDTRGTLNGRKESGGIIHNTAPADSARYPLIVRNLAATPPNYLLVLAFVPVAVAFYICSTRYSQYYHHGFDIICGALIGILTSWGSFRWYHLPLRRGHGWGWGARSRSRAFGIAVGTNGYSDGDG